MRVAVLLSGGVDSSVALRLLLDEGHEVEAFYLKVWLEEEVAALGECPWEDDLRYARAVCGAAGVPLHVVPFQRPYYETVVAPALEELAAGRTPSPDIQCNRRVKFGAFLDHLGGRHHRFDRIASGHYARLSRDGGEVALLRGVDPVKDQTYFLFRLTREQLEACCFPLGGLDKRQVRRLAGRLDLPNRDRQESQGICFLGEVPYDRFVQAYLGHREGEILDADSGRRLGSHRGHWFVTLGQRRGLGLSGGPWYVVRKEVRRNVIWVAHERSFPRYHRREAKLIDVHWIGQPPERVGEEGVYTVKVRHSPQLEPATLTPQPGGSWSLRLEHPDPGLAPGQAAVVYRGDLCLGGGTLDLD